jgi:hypothetical protein
MDAWPERRVMAWAPRPPDHFMHEVISGHHFTAQLILESNLLHA